MTDPIESFRMDRTALSVGSLADESDDRQFWLSRSPQERLLAVEFLRVVHYGYDSTTARLQRILRVAELGES